MRASSQARAFRGDMGTTALADGTTVSKCDPRLAAAGDIDELRCAVRLLDALLKADGIDSPPLLQAIEQDLGRFERELGTPGRVLVARDRVAALDAWLSGNGAPASETGGGVAASQARMCRAICRRAERGVTDLAQYQAVGPSLRPYLNRLAHVMETLPRRFTCVEGPSPAHPTGDSP